MFSSSPLPLTVEKLPQALTLVIVLDWTLKVMGTRVFQLCTYLIRTRSRLITAPDPEK